MASIYLTSDETLRCREAFEAHAEDYATNIFQLRLICGDLGQYPSDDQLKVCLKICKGRVDLSLFCRFALYLKYLYTQQDAQHEEEDDTNSAFAALIEAANTVSENTVPTSRLLQICESFSLQTDALGDALGTLDGGRNGSLTLEEFKTMWAYFATAAPDANPMKEAIGARAGVASHPPAPYRNSITDASALSPMNASQKKAMGLKNAPLDVAIAAFIKPGESLGEEESSSHPAPRRRVSRRGSLSRRNIALSGREDVSLEESTLGKDGRRRSMHLDSLKAENANGGMLLSNTVPNMKAGTSEAKAKALAHSLDARSHVGNSSTKQPNMTNSMHSPLNNTIVYQPVHLPPIRPRKPNRGALQSTVLEKRLEAMRNSRVKFQRSSHHTKGMLVHDDLNA